MRQLATEYLKRRQDELGCTIDPEDYPAELQRVKAYLALHNVYGVDLNATHLRATRGGIVTGRAEVLHRGRTLLSHEVRMTDEEDRLLSIVRITNMVLASKA